MCMLFTDDFSCWIIQQRIDGVLIGNILRENCHAPIEALPGYVHGDVEENHEA
jgi:hypothetical protein